MPSRAETWCRHQSGALSFVQLVSRVEHSHWSNCWCRHQQLSQWECSTLDTSWCRHHSLYYNFPFIFFRIPKVFVRILKKSWMKSWFKRKKNFRVRLLVRAQKSLNVQKALSELIKKFSFEKGIKLTVDVDPISFN